MPYRKTPHSADTPPVVAMSSATKQLSSFPVHVAFNGSYTGRTSLANPGTSGGTPLTPSVEAPVPVLSHMKSYHALVHMSPRPPRQDTEGMNSNNTSINTTSSRIAKEHR